MGFRFMIHFRDVRECANINLYMGINFGAH